MADADPPGGPDDVRRDRKLNEDWASVIVGLALLALILVGAVTNAWVP